MKTITGGQMTWGERGLGRDSQRTGDGQILYENLVIALYQASDVI